MRETKVEAILNVETDELDVTINCSPTELLGIIDTLINVFAKETGIARNSVVENFKEKEGETNE